ncbi:hypothetical protein [Terrisporobacter glycolicus]|uniref:Peptidase M50 domain-containing protein n=1 Tax=Terrisporobacter glycolicus ATCC 14880 = DSM 1288 TaxID=1121315 RepID=A0ABZ2EV76_9FIRM|nr:hypothetical protein [Terrisporobacter glycolicus]
MSFSFINFIIYPLVYIIFMPVLAFIHELGHAIPALIFTKNEVSVNIGNYNLIKKVKLNRLVINIYGYRSIMDVSYAYVNWETLESKFKSIIMIAGGPIASLCTSIVLYLTLEIIQLPYLIMKIFNGILLCSIGQFIVTALPMKYSDNGPYKGFTSDGYKIEQWLKMKNTN